MTVLVPVTMFGWVPAVFVIFWMLPPQRALLVAFLVAWLFLPLTEYKLPMIPAYTKMTAATLGSLFGLLAFDSGRLFKFRPSWVDLPLVIWCVGRFASSMSNGYGPYDGLSSVEQTLLAWGLPWLFGRLYFNSREGIRDLAVGLAIGGLVYVPLCLLEAKISPVLAGMIYGTHVDFIEARRFGGWRPTVFMQHGLMVGMWMSMSGLIAWWLWITGQQFSLRVAIGIGVGA